MIRICITGALGHIGSKFIRSLNAKDYQDVLLLDNLLTQRYCSLFNLPAGINYHFINCDILTYDLESIFNNYDIVVHLAAITDADLSYEISEKVENINLNGTKLVAQACAKCGCKMIFISTTSVYSTKKNKISEKCSNSCLNPQTPYARSKLLAEKYLYDMGKKQKLKYVIFRFGTIFGTSIGMRFHTAFNKFVWQACIGEPISLWQTAMYQIRPYLDLDDAISGINYIIRLSLFNNQIYNMVTINTSVSEILFILKNYVPHYNIQVIDSKAMNDLSFIVSNLKIRKIGFIFNGNMEDKIRETVNLFSNISSYK